MVEFGLADIFIIGIILWGVWCYKILIYHNQYSNTINTVNQSLTKPK